MNLPQESCITSYSPMSYHVTYEANYLLSLKFLFSNIKKNYVRNRVSIGFHRSLTLITSLSSRGFQGVPGFL